MRWLLFFLCLSVTISVFLKSERGRSISSQDFSCAEEIGRIKITKDFQENEELLSEIKEAYKLCLSEYIRIKTVSPEGNEHRAVKFLESIFKKINIPYKRFFTKDLTRKDKNYHRENIIATYSSDSPNSYDWATKKKRRSIILLHHMDVVSVKEEQWKSPDLPFSGAIFEDDDGEEQIWGRGSLDMKGIGLVQLFNVWILKSLNIPVKRDIHLLAVSDEEQSGSGAIGTIRKMSEGKELYALQSANLLLNEGGAGIKDVLKEGVDMFFVSVEEKGGAWLEIKDQSLDTLLYSLYKSKIVDINRIVPKKERELKLGFHSCKVTKVFTPKAKVNVVTSIVEVNFHCPEVEDRGNLLKSAFTYKAQDQIEVEMEKNGEHDYWLKLKTKTSTHGSVKFAESVLTHLVAGLYRLDMTELVWTKKKPSFFRFIETSATTTLLQKLAGGNFLIRIIKTFRFLRGIRRLLFSSIEEEFGAEGLFRTNCQLSALSYDSSIGPKALVDCRLVHNVIGRKSREHAKDFVASLNKYIKSETIDIKILDGWNVSQSSSKSADYKILIRNLQRDKRFTKNKIIAVPYLFPAGSDSAWFRNPYLATEDEKIKPIASYGYFPIYLKEKHLSSMHGVDERFPTDQIIPTILRYNRTLQHLAKRKRKQVLKKTIQKIGL